MAEKIIDTAALIDSLRILLWDRSKTREELAELVIGLIEEAGRECDPESLRPSGRWVHDHYEDCTEQFEIVKCSNCGYTAYAMALFVKSGNFCPNCGAKMEEMMKNGTEKA